MHTVSFSLDAELAWGFHAEAGSFDRRIRRSRRAWHRTRSLFDDYEIPATWAIVGHLFLDQCDGRHPAHPTPDGWFDADPGGSLHENDLWFGPDLVRALQRSRVEHEIGCHSFSHVRFGQVEDAKIIAAELEASAQAAAPYDVEINSFAFPNNSIGHREQLAEHGYVCYRGLKPTEPYQDSRFRRPSKVATYLSGRAPPVMRPRIDDHGLVNIPASLYLYGFEGAVGSAIRATVGDPVVRRAKAGVDRAADGDGVCHFWLHPNNLVTETDAERLQSVLAYVNKRRAAGDIEVQTLRDVAATVQQPGIEA